MTDTLKPINTPDGEPKMDLILPLKGEYFDQIKTGTKTEEYRLANSYWQKRLLHRTYERIILTRGYPRREDHEKRIVLPYKGWRMKIITHPHFGPHEVSVFAIDVKHNTTDKPQPAKHQQGSSDD